MDYFIKHLEETLKAIKTMNGCPITVKKIRMAKGVTSSDRSQINFIWRTLEYLERKGVLVLNGSRNPKSYTIVKKLDMDVVISQAKKERV